MRLSHDPVSRLSRLLFTLVMTLAWTGLPQTRAAADPADPGAPNNHTDADGSDINALAARLEKVFAAVERSDRLLPRDTFEPGAVVAAVGKDPDRLFEWVRDRTEWVPYRGALRGPAGVLMDRVGNSLDRALLLADLLRGAGHTVRLARAGLSEQTAKDLLGKLNTAARPAPDSAGDGSAWERALDAEAKEQGLDPAKLRRDVEKVTAPVAQLSEALAQRVAEQTPALLELLGGGPVDPKDASAKGAKADTGADGAAADMLALRDHWWVQRQDGGKWVDLDPALPDHRPGVALSPAESTVDVPADAAPPALGRDGWQEVTVRVVIEQWKDGRLARTPVLQTVIRPAELAGKRVVFFHTPTDWPADLDLSSEADPAAKLGETLLRQEGWVPTLRVGDTTLAKVAFKSTGEIDPRPNLDAMAKTGKSVAGAADKISSLLDDLDAPAPGATPKAGDGVLTAEWLEYDVRVPGAETMTQRRDVFDLVGPAARAAAGASGAVPRPPVDEAQRLARALAVGGVSEIVVLGGRPSLASVQHRFNASLLDARDAVRAMLKAGAAGDVRGALRAGEPLSPLPAAPYVFAAARAEWSRGRDQSFLGRPNVIAYHRRLGAGGGGGGLTRQTLFDVVANDVAVRPAARADAFRVRLEQGVVDTNLEALLVRSEAAPVNASELFARGAAQTVRWVTVRSDSDPAWASVAASDDVRARVRDDLAAGYVVVVPEKPTDLNGAAATGWWRVDPRTGQALGMTEAGGASFAEYALKVSITIGVAGFTFIGCGGAAAGASTGKRIGCAVCAAVAGALTALAFIGAAAAAAGAAAPGAAAAASSTGGVAGASVAGMACNALSGFAS